MRGVAFVGVFLLGSGLVVAAPGDATQDYAETSDVCRFAGVLVTDLCVLEEHGQVATDPSACDAQGCVLSVGGGTSVKSQVPADGILAAWVETSEGRTEICRIDVPPGQFSYGCQTVVEAFHAVAAGACAEFRLRAALAALNGSLTNVVRADLALCRDAAGQPSLVEA